MTRGDGEAVAGVLDGETVDELRDLGEDAFAHLYGTYADGLPHKTLLQVFELLGNEHPLVTLFRRKLYQALY